MPRWYYSDSTWVRNTPRAGGTITDRIVVVSFRNGVTAEQRAAVYRRVAAHPEACGVEQAIKVLEQVPEIDLAAPDDHGVGTGDGQIAPAPGGRQSQGTPCPEGTSLLR